MDDKPMTDLERLTMYGNWALCAWQNMENAIARGEQIRKIIYKKDGK